MHVNQMELVEICGNALQECNTGKQALEEGQPLDLDQGTLILL